MYLQDIDELISELQKLKKEHGRVAIIHDIELDILGISHKYLLVKSEIAIVKEKSDGIQS